MPRNRFSATRRRFLRAAAIGTVSGFGMWGNRARGNQRSPDRLDELPNYVVKAMARWEVPGLAIAVVQDDKLIHAQGYGFRILGAESKVDAETIFSIASCTK